MSALNHTVTAMRPAHADDVCAVHVNFAVSEPGNYMNVTRMFTIAQARELSNLIGRAADEAELRLAK